MLCTETLSSDEIQGALGDLRLVSTALWAAWNPVRLRRILAVELAGAVGRLMILGRQCLSELLQGPGQWYLHFIIRLTASCECANRYRYCG